MFDAPWHIVIVVLVVLALFGYKRLPEMSRSVARSLRIFKTEMKGLSDDDAARDAHAAQQFAVPAAAPQPPAAFPVVAPTPPPAPPAAPVPPPAPPSAPQVAVTPVAGANPVMPGGATAGSE
ncbi:MAG TPA: Sec-independent protein translocase subunit TatA [Jatrophihabitantaceae bacterium]|jgi:sec-independent protein translocase protein TatA|nr:Sec-independent protein translocase subunit TatA [Jatrophihabitantaceae bacterium]